jgi:hypothetical protein
VFGRQHPGPAGRALCLTGNTPGLAGRALCLAGNTPNLAGSFLCREDFHNGTGEPGFAGAEHKKVVKKGNWVYAVNTQLEMRRQTGTGPVAERNVER